MEIILDSAGKKYQDEWVFQNLSLQIRDGGRMAVLGANATGKTTLLKMIAGLTNFSEGTMSFVHDEKNIPAERIYRYFSMVSPITELIHEFNVMEMIRFYGKFKPFLSGINIQEQMFTAGFKDISNKRISELSSGNLQKLKLFLALFSETPLLLLDEPTTGLDEHSTGWYREQIRNIAAERIVIVTSNQNRVDYDFCSNSIRMEDYKATG